MTSIDAGVWYGWASYEKACLSHIEHLNLIYKVEKEHFLHSPNWHFLRVVLQGNLKANYKYH